MIPSFVKQKTELLYYDSKQDIWSIHKNTTAHSLDFSFKTQY